MTSFLGHLSRPGPNWRRPAALALCSANADLPHFSIRLRLRGARCRLLRTSGFPFASLPRFRVRETAISPPSIYPAPYLAKATCPASTCGPYSILTLYVAMWFRELWSGRNEVVTRRYHLVRLLMQHAAQTSPTSPGNSGPFIV
jgi:hypothetical protein